MSDLIDRIESARLAWVSARTLEDGAFERAKYERRLFEAWPTMRDELERLTRELAEAQQEIAAQVQNDYQRVDWIKENMRLVERAERAEADLTRYQTHVVFPSKDGTRNLTLSGTAEAADELARQRWAAESDREQLRAAIAELVRLKDLHDSLEGAGFETHVEWLKLTAKQRDYDTNKPLAWERARALAKEEKPTMNEHLLAKAAATRRDFYDTHLQVLREIDAERKEEKPNDARPCTCHPDDDPPRPCPRKYALAECWAAMKEPKAP
jgi:hypothetical protein